MEGADAGDDAAALDAGAGETSPAPLAGSLVRSRRRRRLRRPPHALLLALSPCLRLHLVLCPPSASATTGGRLTRAPQGAGCAGGSRRRRSCLGRRRGRQPRASSACWHVWREPRGGVPGAGLRGHAAAAVQHPQQARPCRGDTALRTTATRRTTNAQASHAAACHACFSRAHAAPGCATTTCAPRASTLTARRAASAKSASRAAAQQQRTARSQQREPW